MFASRISFNRVIVFVLVGILLLMLAVPGKQLFADRAYQSAREAYLKVEKDDPEVLDIVKWEKAASKLIEFIKDFPRSESHPKALYVLGVLYQQIFEKRKLSTAATHAAYYFERLVVEFPEDQLVDDALLYLGDLRRDALGDDIGARKAYFKIIDAYPKSDNAKVARLRLSDRRLPIEAGTNVDTDLNQKGKISKSEVAVDEFRKEDDSEEGFFSWLGSFGGRKKKGREIYKKEGEARRLVIVIDPGHGGQDLGAVGVDNVAEKEVVLDIAYYLDELLRERLRANTILTRGRDVSLDLAERTKIANDAKADLFISIHANASERKNTQGIETYYLDNTDDKSSLTLAMRENSAGNADIPDLDFILSDLIQNAKLEDSISLAHYVQKSMHATLSRYYKDVVDLGVKKAPFYVLVGAHMPCVLVEVAFIDHSSEGKRLAKKDYQKLVAAALYKAIRAYFENQ